MPRCGAGKPCVVSQIRGPLEDRLAASHEITLVLRLTGDREGVLVRGEAVDVQGGWHCRFARWDVLVRCVRERLRVVAGQAPGGSFPPSPRS